MRLRLALIALAVLALSACTSTPKSSVATADRPAPAATKSAPATRPSPTPSESDYDKALRYARCMNDHGTRMADPVVGQPLQVGSMLAGGWQAQTSDAFAKCKQFLPATWPVKVDPNELIKERPSTSACASGACRSTHRMRMA